MTIISFIKDEEVIKKILKHLRLWNVKVSPPPEVKVFPCEDQNGLLRFSGLLL